MPDEVVLMGLCALKQMRKVTNNNLISLAALDSFPNLGKPSQALCAGSPSGCARAAEKNRSFIYENGSQNSEPFLQINQMFF